DMCMVQWPSENELREEPNHAKGDRERKNADEQAGAQIRLERSRIDFRAGEKSQDATPEHSQKIDPLVVRLEVEKIPRQNPDENFNQRDRYSGPDRDQTGRQ